MLNKFTGIVYKTSNNWLNDIPLENKPIRYLEIGVLYGANLFSVCDTYAHHPLSEVYAIDPWVEYKEYNEYKGQQKEIYQTFNNNLENRVDKNKIKVIKGFSYKEIPKLEDEYFDIIYIDGNHSPEYILEDAVLSFRKLKSGGYLIFDDYGWGGPEMTQKAIYAFIHTYSQKIKNSKLINNQAIIMKK